MEESSKLHRQSRMRSLSLSSCVRDEAEDRDGWIDSIENVGLHRPGPGESDTVPRWASLLPLISSS